MQDDPDDRATEAQDLQLELQRLAAQADERQGQLLGVAALLMCLPGTAPISRPSEALRRGTFGWRRRQHDGARRRDNRAKRGRGRAHRSWWRLIAGRRSSVAHSVNGSLGKSLQAHHLPEPGAAAALYHACPARGDSQ